MVNGRITTRDLEIFQKAIFKGKTKAEYSREILNQIDYVKLKFFLDFPDFLRDSITHLEPCVYQVDDKTALEKLFCYAVVSYAASTGEQGKFINYLATILDSQHPEIFDNFLEGLRSAFSITTDDYKLWMKYLGTASLECSLKLQTIPFIKPDEKGYEIWNAIELDTKKNDEYIKAFNVAKEASENYLFKTYAKVEKKTAIEKISFLDKYKDSPLYNFYTKYYAAAADMYELDIKNADEFSKEKVLKAFQDAFESGKHLLGREYRKFLTTIISAEVYLSGKSGKRCQEYFDFAKALGIFTEKDREQILSPFYAKLNFWKMFLPFKFNKQDETISQYRDDLYDSELIEPYMRSKTKRGAEDYINNTQNGASALIRLLQEYKCARYGFSDEFRQNRAKLLFDLSEKLKDAFISTSKEENEDSVLFNDDMMDKFDTKFRSAYETFVDKYMQLIPEASGKIAQELLDKAEGIKKHILDIIEKSNSDELLKTAYQVDIFNSVNALRLAVDAFDSDIVGAIVKKLRADDIKLSGLVVDKNNTTLLQYAIKKYDLFMQDIDNINKGKTRRPLTEHTVPYSDAGFYNPSSVDMFYKKQSVCDIVRTFPWEENGFVFHPTYARELVNIIQRISAYSDKITSNDFYYMMVQADLNDGQTYTDVIDLANYMVKNGKVTFKEGADIQSMADTVVTFAARSENLSFLKFLLTDAREVSKDVINEKVIGSERGSFTEETALHMFLLSQLDTLKIAAKDMAHSGSLFDETLSKIKTFLPLFKDTGARTDIPNESGKSVDDIIAENKELLKGI